MTGQLQFPEPIEGAINPAAGERAKHVGITQAAEHTPATWAAKCDKAIADMAARGVVFQAADLIAEGLVDEPDHPNQWGARFQVAARAGIIRAAGYGPSKRATVHKSACRLWVGAHAAERAA